MKKDFVTFQDKIPNCQITLGEADQISHESCRHILLNQLSKISHSGSTV